MNVQEITNHGTDAKNIFAGFFAAKKAAEKAYDTIGEATANRQIAELATALSIGLTQWDYYRVSEEIDAGDVAEMSPAEMIRLGFNKEFIEAVKAADAASLDPILQNTGISQTRASFINCRAYLARICKGLDHTPAFWGRNWANVAKAISVCSIQQERSLRECKSLPKNRHMFWLNLAVGEVTRLSAVLKQAIVNQAMATEPSLEDCQDWDNQEGSPSPDGGWVTWFLQSPAGQEYKENMDVQELEDDGQWDWAE